MSPPGGKRRVIKKKGEVESEPKPKLTPIRKPKSAPEVKEEKPLDDEFEELESMTLPDPLLMNKNDGPTKEHEEPPESDDVKGPPEPKKVTKKPSRPVRKSKKTEPHKPSVSKPVEKVKDEAKPLKSKKEVEALLEEDEKSLNINKTLLIIGIILCGLGLVGMLGLRAGFIQSLLGDAAPYPGIGTVEPTGHIVSVVPIILGIVSIFVWGMKNNQAYYELEKSKDEPFAFEELDTEPEKTPESIEPKTQEAEVPLKDVKTPEPEHPKVDKSVEEPSELARKFAQAEDERVAECEKSLEFADITPDDAKRLRYLIPTGMTPSDFTIEVEKAEKQKKEEKEKKLRSEKDAAVLEEELAAGFADLEEEINEDDEDPEEKAMRQFEDLEDL